ncbi:reverse transcriptase domain-containing protein [Tanacetum coccineum]
MKVLTMKMEILLEPSSNKLLVDEIAASLSNPRLAKKSKGPSQVRVHSALDIIPEPNRPSRKRKLKKIASEAGSSSSELGQAEGMNEADLTNFCAKIKNCLKRDESTSTRAASAPTPRLGKRLGAPPSMAIVSAYGPSHVGTSVHASTFGRSFSLGVACGLLSATISGHTGKSEAEVVPCQIDPLDSLARSALARDVEYDQIPENDFSTATRGEEINLTLFPLTPGPYQMSYPYKGASSPPYTKEEKALDRTITPAELKRTNSLLPLDLSNHFNVLSALLVSYGAELNSRYTSLVTAKNHLQEKFDQKAGYVKVLRWEVTTLDGKLERIQKDCDAVGQENRELRSQKDVASDKVKELQTELTDARVSSIGLSEELSKTDAKDEVTWFVGSGVESLVRKLLSSDEFYTALAHVASLGINYGFERGLRMGRTDAEFEVAAQKVSNFHNGAKSDFDKALVDFPTTLFPFLGKIVAAAEGTLPEELLQAPTNGVRDVIVVPPVLASQFELKIGCLILLPLSRFMVLKMMILIPISEGAARTWLEKEPPNSITTWNDIVSKFVNQFFPPSRTTNPRNKITRFQQKFNETFSEAWAQFKDLLNKCPHNGFSHLHQIDTFYNGLSQSDQDSLNSAVGGNLLTRNTQEALTIIENKSKVRTSRNKPQVLSKHISIEY